MAELERLLIGKTIEISQLNLKLDIAEHRLPEPVVESQESPTAGKLLSSPFEKATEETIALEMASPTWPVAEPTTQADPQQEQRPAAIHKHVRSDFEEPQDQAQVQLLLRQLESVKQTLSRERELAAWKLTESNRALAEAEDSLRRLKTQLQTFSDLIKAELMKLDSLIPLTSVAQACFGSAASLLLLADRHALPLSLDDLVQQHLLKEKISLEIALKKAEKDLFFKEKAIESLRSQLSAGRSGQVHASVPVDSSGFGLWSDPNSSHFPQEIARLISVYNSEGHPVDQGLPKPQSVYKNTKSERFHRLPSVHLR